MIGVLLVFSCMCTGYRKVNSVTKTDSFPVLRMDDCINNIGQAKYATKFNLLKGFWQIPLMDRAKEISAFVTPDGLYQYKVMPFGMKNWPATFQHLINMIITGLDNCKAYIDDAIIYSEEWDQQIKTIREFFERLSKAKLTIKPGRVAQSVGHLTRESGVLGSIPSLATYFRFSFRFFKKGSCQLLAKVCARSTG